jgi:hypothetical protein
MLNKIQKLIIISLVILSFYGCSSEITQKVNYPFETLKIIPSKENKTMSITIIKTGINGGATVPFEYKFYFSKNDTTLSKNKLFLVVRGLDTYKINWSSVNTIDINISASRVVMFKSDVLLKDNKISNFYYVNKIIFNK